MRPTVTVSSKQGPALGETGAPVRAEPGSGTLTAQFGAEVRLGWPRVQSRTLNLNSWVCGLQGKAPLKISGSFPVQVADFTGWPGTHTCLPRPGSSRLEWPQSGTKKGWDLRKA